MVQKIVLVSLVFVASSSLSTAFAQTTVITNPSPIVETTASPVGVTTETYYCQKCRTYHTRQVSRPAATALPQVVNSTQVAQVQYTPAPSVTPAQVNSGGASNVLDMLNSQRSRQGLNTLAYDPQLQAVANRRAARMAASGTKGHPSGSFAPGRYEGVGWSSSYSPSGVSACFTSDPRMRAAGAAMVTGRDGVYFCVVYR